MAKKPIRIAVEEAKKYADKHDVIFLDVVDPGAYEKTEIQIKGAVRIDPRDIKEEYEKLPKGRDVLAYCT